MGDFSELHKNCLTKRIFSRKFKPNRSKGRLVALFTAFVFIDVGIILIVFALKFKITFATPK